MDNVYQFVRNNIMAKLNRRFSASETLMILGVFDECIADYDIVQRETALVPYEDHSEKWMELYLACREVDGLSKQTLKNKMYILRDFFRNVGRQIEDIRSVDIKIYLANYKKQRNISESSLNKIRSAIRSFFVWMRKEGYIEKNPSDTIEDVHKGEKSREALTLSEQEMVRISCKNQRERAAVEFLISSGCRITEMLTIKRESIDWKNRKVSVLGKGGKWRDVFFSESAAIHLKKYLSETKDSIYLFGHTKNMKCGDVPVSKRQFEKMLADLRERSGISTHLTPHVLRHTFATNALRAGMSIQSIQALLGHSQISTTMRYAHNDKTIVAAEYYKYVA